MKKCTKCNSMKEGNHHSWCKTCLKKAVAERHKTPEGKAMSMWCNICSRIKRPIGKNSCYKNVKILIKREDFIKFAVPAIRDFMKHNPKSIPSVDRIENEKHYEVGNLRIVSTLQNSIQRKRNVRVNAPIGFSWCTKCKQYLPIEEFYNSKNRFNGLSHECKSCKYFESVLSYQSKY